MTRSTFHLRHKGGRFADYALSVRTVDEGCLDATGSHGIGEEACMANEVLFIP